MKRFNLAVLLGTAVWLAAPVAAATDLPASLDWGKRVELSTPVSGVIQNVPVKPGQRVEKDTVLLKLDQRLPTAAKAEATEYSKASSDQPALRCEFSSRQCARLRFRSTAEIDFKPSNQGTG